MNHHCEITSDLSSEELTRYSRQLILPQIQLAGQIRLKNARVLIVGLGGLGSSAAYYLGAAGVGTLGLADWDRVEEHNLHRQILHDTGSIGRPKVDSAMEKLENLNPHVHFHLHPEGVTVENALELLEHYDLIVDGSDNFPTRYLLNDAAVLAGKPLVYGSIFQFEGQISLFHTAAGGSCYRCLFPSTPAPDAIPNCSEAGVIGALCGMIGSMQAMEAIKFLTNSGENLVGRLLIVDALASNFQSLKIQKNIDCPVCGTHPTITTLDTINPKNEVEEAETQ